MWRGGANGEYRDLTTMEREEALWRHACSSRQTGRITNCNVYEDWACSDRCSFGYGTVTELLEIHVHLQAKTFQAVEDRMWRSLIVSMADVYVLHAALLAVMM